jgi:site-specific DNA recombinase
VTDLEPVMVGEPLWTLQKNGYVAEARVRRDPRRRARTEIQRERHAVLFADIQSLGTTGAGSAGEEGGLRRAGLEMTVAIYARKSTDQSGVSEEQRSVARQVEHARAYAARKGWQVLDEHVYVDDGISGAEFERRPGLQRLRATLRPRPPFAVLIVSEQSRLSRDTADTLQFLKELARAGVRVFTYQDDRPISIETPSDTLVTTINAWKDSEARRESSVRTHEALARKAKAAHVTGGRVFGYRNVDVFSGVDAHGRPLRSHVTREIRNDEAAVVRRIFELCAGGLGVKRIASSLNVAGLPRPRAQQGRRDGWCPSSVRSVLFRDLYRGVEWWNRTKKRNAFGQVQVRDRDRIEWLRVDVPEWRIVPEALWEAAHARLAKARKNYLAGTQGARWGRPVTGTAAKYLLTGLGRCGVCGGGLTVRSRAHGKAQRSYRYVCSTHHYRVHNGRCRSLSVCAAVFGDREVGGRPEAAGRDDREIGGLH